MQPLFLRMLDDEGGTIRLSEPLLLLLLGCEGTRLDFRCCCCCSAVREVRVDTRCRELGDAVVAADTLLVV